MRPVGEPEPPGIRATDTQGGFFWIYAPVRFDDHALVTIVQERPSGERIMQDAHRVFPLGSGRSAEWLGRPEHQLRFAPGTRSVTGATLHLLRGPREQDGRGRGRDPLPFPLLWAAVTASSRIGSTGCTRASWSSRASPCPRPIRPISTWALTEYAAKFTYDGQVGYGMFECAVMGPHQQYGFTGWD